MMLQLPRYELKDQWRCLNLLKFKFQALQLDPEKSNSSADTESQEKARLKQQAVVEKDKGNDHFKQGRYDQAIACYTKVNKLLQIPQKVS